MSLRTLNRARLNTSAEFFTEALARESGLEFSKIAEKILEAERLSFEDGSKLIHTSDLLVLGQLANYFRQKKSYEVALREGFDEQVALKRIRQVWWNTNMHLNPSNVCIGDCDFCSFARRPNEEGAYTMSIDQALEEVSRGVSGGAREVHIVGGLNPKTLLDYYSDLLRAIKRDFPQIHIKAFTAVEIEFFSKFAKKSYSEIFDILIRAGLDSMPGGGAEIFSRAVRDERCPDKIPAETWIEIHKVAHSKGLKTNATMLAGIGEAPEERIEHLDILRKAQDQELERRSQDSQGQASFQTFIPLSCHYEGNDLLEKGIKPLTAYDQLKNIAVSRLMLDNFDNIKAYWVQLGEKMAQLALSFGANDLDGTVQTEKITNMAGAKKSGLAKNVLIDIIEGARLEALERDTVYNCV
jgi:aminodeoxyfutalosine synthase